MSDQEVKRRLAKLKRRRAREVRDLWRTGARSVELDENLKVARSRPASVEWSDEAWEERQKRVEAARRHQEKVAREEAARVREAAKKAGYDKPPSWWRPARGDRAPVVSDATAYAIAGSLAAIAVGLWWWQKSKRPKSPVVGNSYLASVDALAALGG